MPDLLKDLDDVALDRLIAAEPGHVAALVEKGERKAASGDTRGANAFFRAALAAATRQAAGGALPANLRAPIERAQRGVREGQQAYKAFLRDQLAAAGFPECARPPAFQRSLEMMLGERATDDMGIQRPGQFYFSGLPQRAYYPASAFPWAATVENAAPLIASELHAFMETQGARFSPYLVSNPERPPSNFHGLTDNPAWSTLYLWDNGRPNAGITELFSATMKAMEAVDLPQLASRAPAILFSRLSPGARIPPHHGATNVRLICHLPLIVPEGCGFRVGGESRRWEPGKLLIFDDTVLHEAWNDSDQERIILIFDCWRPEIEADDRRAIAAMFGAIDAMSPPAATAG